MSMLLQVLAMLAGAIVLMTVVAQLNDQPRKQVLPGALGFMRHHAHKLALVLLGAGTGMVLLTILTGQGVPLEALALLLGVALRQITHPHSWWSYVTRGSADPGRLPPTNGPR